MKQIDMSKGDPIEKIPESVRLELINQINIPSNHRYPLEESIGYTELRNEISNWYLRRYNVSVDPLTEVAVLLGSKEGILYFLLSQTKKGDYVVITNPCYQTYSFLIKLSGAIPYEINIGPENNYLPDIKNIPPHILKKVKAVIINYPNNPTGATASLDFYNELIQFATKHNIKIVNDNPYIEFVSNPENKLSILESANSKETCIELNSFSKIFNMAGWRLGMVVGNKGIISDMIKIKQMADAGAFLPMQKAAIKALNVNNDQYVKKLLEKYSVRKKTAVKELHKIGWDYPFQEGTFYLWLPCKGAKNSIQYADFLKDKLNILVNPGIKYGSNGEGYVRISLTVTDNDFNEFLTRLKTINN